MKISCPACAAKYSIADEKVQDKLAKIRCRKCGTTIVIDGKVSPPNVYAGESGASNAEQPAASDPGAAGVAAGEYSVDFGDNDQRTMSLADLLGAYNSGEVTGETFVWTEGMADWSPLGEVQAIVDALNAGSGSAKSRAAPEAAPAPTPSPVAAASGAPWAARVEPQSAQRAAARAGGRSASTSDLFGAFDTAGSEHDVTTSAREPAMPAFGGGAAAAAGANATGARNESSVLFSLSALTSASGSKPMTTSSGGPPSSSNITIAGAPTATKEDSGLIDLKALTASADAGNGQHMAPLQPSPLGMSPPLGLSAPSVNMGLGGVEAQIPMPQQKSRAGIYVGAGIAVAAVAIAAAIIVTNKTPPPPAPTVAAPTPPPPPAPTPAPEDSVTAKPPSTGTDEKTAANAPKKTGGSYAKGGGSKSGGTTSGTDTKSGAAAGGGDKKPAAAAKSPCGCAPADLQCNMKCSAGGK